MENWSLKSKLLALVGAISIALSVFVFTRTVDKNLITIGLREQRYGADAYTGIQNAAACTGRNVSHVADYICYGFSSVLLVAGLTLIVVALPEEEGYEEDDEEVE